MTDYLPFVIAGLTAGAVYALAAMGLVVTYTTSGVFNFAHGAIGMVAAYLCFTLRQDVGVPTPVAVGVCVLVFAPALGLLIDRVLLTRLVGSDPSVYVVVSLGLLVALQGIVLATYGGVTRTFPPLFSQSSYRLPGVNVGWDQTAVILITAATGVGLAWFFRRTHLGLQTRAVVDDRALTMLTGVNPKRVTTFSWMLGSALAALSAILLAPFVGLDVAVLTLLVVQSFGAAIVGRLTSIPLTVVGAVLIGLAANVATKFAVDYTWLVGVPASLPFIVLFATLVLSRKGRFSEVVRRDSNRRRAGRVGSGRGTVAVGLATVLAAAMVPVFASSARLLTATVVVVFILIFSSLGLLTGTARQFSLCHAVFVGLGATTLAHLLDGGVPYPAALLLTGLIFVPVGALIAIPAIRLSGLFLALATFGFGILAQSLVFPTFLGFGKGGGVFIARPEIFGVSLSGGTAFFYFALAVVAAGVASIEIVRRTRLGRVLRALGDSPTALESLGVNPTASYVLVFCVSSFLAAVSGALLGTLFQNVATTTFDFSQSLIWLAVLVAAGAGSLGGAVLAALLLIALPTVVTASWITEYQPVIFGVAAVVFAQSPNGMTAALRLPDFVELGRRWAWRLETSPARARRITDARTS